ncbi:TPA: DUF799 domain-containing protein [Neisseria meningitidis]
MKPLILGLAAVLALSACQVQKAPDFDYTSFKESKPASILVVPPLNEAPDFDYTSFKESKPASILVVPPLNEAPDFDYTSFKESKPASILVVPPLNESPDVNGTWGVLASTAAPLSEAGYYVFPAAVVEETFKQNGLTNAADIHAVRPEKLHQIFGNDAVLYITVTEYGTSYQILDSVTTVSAKARLVDSRNGKELWSGSASIREGSNNSNSGLLGALVSAVVNQIANSLTDRGYQVSKTAAYNLLSPYSHNGILKGPRFVEEQPK